MSFFGKNKKADASDLKLFKSTKKIGNYIWLDEFHKLLMVSTKDMMKPKYLLRYDNIVSFSVFQDDKEIIKKNGIQRALIGGVLFGGTGAVVGAITGSQEPMKYVKNLWITIELDGKNTEKKSINIPFIISKKTSTTSNTYKNMMINLENCVNILNEIITQKE